MTIPSWESLQLVSEPTILGPNSASMFHPYHYAPFPQFSAATALLETHFHGSPCEVQTCHIEQQVSENQCAYQYNQAYPNFNPYAAANYPHNLHQFLRTECQTFPSVEQNLLCHALHSEQPLHSIHVYDSPNQCETQRWESEQSLIASEQPIFDEILLLVRENIRRFEQCQSEWESYQPGRATCSDSPKVEDEDQVFEIMPEKEETKLFVQVFDKIPEKEEADVSNEVQVFDKIPEGEEADVSNEVQVFGEILEKEETDVLSEVQLFDKIPAMKETEQSNDDEVITHEWDKIYDLICNEYEGHLVCIDGRGELQPHKIDDVGDKALDIGNDFETKHHIPFEVSLKKSDLNVHKPVKDEDDENSSNHTDMTSEEGLQWNEKPVLKGKANEGQKVTFEPSVTIIDEQENDPAPLTLAIHKRSFLHPDETGLTKPRPVITMAEPKNLVASYTKLGEIWVGGKSFNTMLSRKIIPTTAMIYCEVDKEVKFVALDSLSIISTHKKTSKAGTIVCSRSEATSVVKHAFILPCAFAQQRELISQSSNDVYLPVALCLILDNVQNFLVDRYLYEGKFHKGWCNRHSHSNGFRSCSKEICYISEFKCSVTYHFRNGDQFEYFEQEIHGGGLYYLTYDRWYEGSWQEGPERDYKIYTFTRCGERHSGKLNSLFHPLIITALRVIRVSIKVAEKWAVDEVPDSSNFGNMIVIDGAQRVTDYFQEARKRKIIQNVDQRIMWLHHNFGRYTCILLDTGQGTNMRRRLYTYLLEVMQNFQLVVVLTSHRAPEISLGIQPTEEVFLESFLFFEPFCPSNTSARAKKLRAEIMKVYVYWFIIRVREGYSLFMHLCLATLLGDHLTDVCLDLLHSLLSIHSLSYTVEEVLIKKIMVIGFDTSSLFMCLTSEDERILKYDEDYFQHCVVADKPITALGGILGLFCTFCAVSLIQFLVILTDILSRQFHVLVSFDIELSDNRIAPDKKIFPLPRICPIIEVAGLSHGRVEDYKRTIAPLYLWSYIIELIATMVIVNFEQENNGNFFAFDPGDGIITNVVCKYTTPLSWRLIEATDHLYRVTIYFYVMEALETLNGVAIAGHKFGM